MKRLLAALFFLVSISFAHAQDALVVSSCGSPPPIYSNPGDVLPLTIDTTGKLCTALAGGGLSGSGVSGQVTVWNSVSSVTGFTGFTYTDPGQLTLALATITTNLKALTITGTFNAAGTTFDAPLFMNITNTASAAGSLLFDFQVGGTSLITGTVAGVLKSGAVAGGALLTWSQGARGIYAESGAVTLHSDSQAFAGPLDGSGGNWLVLSNGALGWNTATVTYLFSQTSGNVSQVNLANAQTFRVYNTTDSNTSPTNFERAVFDWTTTANVLTIGTQAGGTGTVRDLFLSIGANAAAVNLQNGGGNPQIEFLRNNTNIGVWTFSGINFPTTNNPTFSVNGDTSIGRAAPGVYQFGNSTTSNANGWMNWAGEARLDADFSKTSSTALANVTGTTHSLTVNLQAARNYIFEISLPIVTGATAGGFQVALSGTATVTNLIVDGFCVDGPTAVIINTTRVSALGSAIVANTNAGTTPKCTFWGTFEALAAGTFTTQFAQNASSATASTVKRGAYMLVNDAP